MTTLRSLPRATAGATLALGLLLGLTAHTQTPPTTSPAACCLAPTALAEALVAPPVGGDEDFFSAAGAPATVMLLVGNNESMQDYVAPIPDGAAGCADADPFAATFTATGGQTPVDADPGLASAFFRPERFYLAHTYRLVTNARGLSEDFRSVASFPGGTGTAAAPDGCLALDQDVRSRVAAATPAWGMAPADLAACRTCLATKGWYRLGRIHRVRNGTNEFRTVVLTAPNPNGSEVRFRERNDRYGNERAVFPYALKGHILNQRPPKFVTARRVVKNVLDRADNIRVGVATFSESVGNLYDPPLIFSALAEHPDPSVGPTCSLSYAVGGVTRQQVAEAMATTRVRLKRQINNSTDPVGTPNGLRFGLTFTNQELSTGESLFGIAGFFSMQARGEGTEGFWARTTSGETRGMGFNPATMGYPAGWPGGSQPDSGLGWHDNETMWVRELGDGEGRWTTGDAPFSRRTRANGAPEDDNFCWSCAKAAVVVINDGAPYNDNSVPVTRMRELGLVSGPVNHCPDPAVCDVVTEGPRGSEPGNRNFMDDVAAFMSNPALDLRPDLTPGNQNLLVYTIGFGTNAPMLASIARAGGTETVRSAANQEELEEQLMKVVGDISENATSFSAASLQSIQTGGMQSSLFVPRFHPTARPMWQGHLYRFATWNEFVEGCRYRGCPAHPTEPSPAGARCTATGALEPLHAADLDQDGSCEGVHMVDSPCTTPSCEGQTRGPLTRANIIEENAQGAFFRKYGSSGAGGAAAGEPTLVRPYWDAQAALATQSASRGCAAGGRCIFTVVDRGGPDGASVPDGKLDAHDNPPLEFVDTNADTLAPYLTASLSDAACQALLVRAGTPAVPASSTLRRECTLRIIEYVRGMNTLGWDNLPRSAERPCVVEKRAPAANGTPAQPIANCKLGDIFHSSPVLVDPPIEPLVCDMALHPQCVQTLYARPGTFQPRTEPRCAEGVEAPCYRETPLAAGDGAQQTAYDTFLADVGYRQRVVIVGANDGMLHAFDAGSRVPDRERGAFTFGPDDVYSFGTGKEEWAFIPPDLLPKLRLALDGHQLFVDGTAMVREVWVDGGADGTGDKDGVKQADEFHTLAVVGERGGGTKYFALDITDPLSVKRHALNTTPEAAGGRQAAAEPFRWLFPQACDRRSLETGQTWMNFAPKPPSIGPVRVKPQALTTEDAKRGWSEQWVAFVNGGYDPLQVTGRASYLLDVWTGLDVWSVSAAAPPAATGAGAEGVAASTYASVVADRMDALAAAPAMLDVGRAGHDGVGHDGDGFFDTVTVGDVGGNVWTFRMQEPGVLDADGRVTNWYAARSLEQNRSEGEVDHSERTSFFNISSNALQSETGWLRTFLGTGDRQFMLEKDGGRCTAMNPLACVRIGCQVEVTRTQQVGAHRLVTQVSYAAAGTRTITRTASTAGTEDQCTTAELDVDVSVTCPSSLGTGTGSGSGSGTGATVLTGGGHLRCTVSGAAWTCSEQSQNAASLRSFPTPATVATALPHNRYYGFFAYGGSETPVSPTAPPSRTFKDVTSAVAYDGLRLTDAARGGACGAGMTGPSCSLVDVTLPDPGTACGGTAAGSTTGTTWAVGSQGGADVCYIRPAALSALPSGLARGPGWFVRYWPLDERTASGSSVLNSVVFWSSLTPPDVVQTSTCGETARTSSARSWQADIVTGLPGASEASRVRNGDGTFAGYLPFRRRTVIAPPPEPITALSISRDGRVRQDVNLIEPGRPIQKETLRSARRVANDVYWMELPPEEHLCRHERADACN
jgi:type IV pilus assembly protein PilY1